MYTRHPLTEKNYTVLPPPCSRKLFESDRREKKLSVVRHEQAFCKRHGRKSLLDSSLKLGKIVPMLRIFYPSFSMPERLLFPRGTRDVRVTRSAEEKRRGGLELRLADSNVDGAIIRERDSRVRLDIKIKSTVTVRRSRRLRASVRASHAAFLSLPIAQKSSVTCHRRRLSSSILATSRQSHLSRLFDATRTARDEIFHVSLGHCTCRPARQREYRSLFKYQSTANLRVRPAVSSKVQPGT